MSTLFVALAPVILVVYFFLEVSIFIVFYVLYLICGFIVRKYIKKYNLKDNIIKDAYDNGIFLGEIDERDFLKFRKWSSRKKIKEFVKDWSYSNKYKSENIDYQNAKRKVYIISSSILHNKDFRVYVVWSSCSYNSFFDFCEDIIVLININFYSISLIMSLLVFPFPHFLTAKIIFRSEKKNYRTDKKNFRSAKIG